MILTFVIVGSIGMYLIIKSVYDKGVYDGRMQILNEDLKRITSKIENTKMKGKKN